VKIPIQEKIAELESRIAALEKLASHQRTTVTTTSTNRVVDLEPEAGNVWAAVDKLFAKVFGK
jgi:uncharacterized coiled-coil protein SlyX